MTVEFWFRYEDHADIGYGLEIEVRLHKIPVRKTTPQGVWLRHENSRYGGKWVSASSKKRYAYPTKALAWESFGIRKSRQAGYLRSNLDRVNAVLRLIEARGKEPPTEDLVFSNGSSFLTVVSAEQ